MEILRLTLMPMIYLQHVFQSPFFIALAAATTCSLMVSGRPRVAGVKFKVQRLEPPTYKWLFLMILQLMIKSFGYHPFTTFKFSY